MKVAAFYNAVPYSLAAKDPVGSIIFIILS